ncbi:MAG: 3-deoxy-manno-octulosonate cytidylyltransferase [Pseudomonadota bacterium]
MAINPVIYGIIPARYASSRFEGKPLADILGKPMFWHVYQRAKLCAAFCEVVLATDDERIAAAAEALGVPCVMTASDHVSGTDRVFEAACKLGVAADAIVVNIQGDEPALDPRMLDQLVEPFAHDAHLQTATLAQTLTVDEAASPDRVKVVTAANGDALYFSRSMIPYVRGGQTVSGSLPENATQPIYWGHIGLYAFRMAALEKFTKLAPSRLEQLECLEQLRLLENGITMRVVPTEYRTHGVDRPEDITYIINLLMENDR